MKLDQKAMAKMLERMGIKSEAVNAIKVVIELPDKKLVFENPQVNKTIMQGVEFFTVMGKYVELAKSQEQATEIREEDVKFVMEQTGKSESEVREALKKANGDIAKAILILTGQEGT